MAIAIGDAFSFTQEVDPDYEPIQLSHTVSAGSNLCLVVMIVGEPEGGNCIPENCYWNSSGASQVLTQAGTYNSVDDSLCEVWYKVNPTVASGATIDVGLNSTVAVGNVGIGAFTFTGVDQSDPIRDEAGNSAQNIGSLRANLTGLTSGDFILALAAIEHEHTLDMSGSSVNLTMARDEVYQGEMTSSIGYGTADAAEESIYCVVGGGDGHLTLMGVALIPAADPTLYSCEITDGLKIGDSVAADPTLYSCEIMDGLEIGDSVSHTYTVAPIVSYRKFVVLNDDKDFVTVDDDKEFSTKSERKTFVTLAGDKDFSTQ